MIMPIASRGDEAMQARTAMRSLSNRSRQHRRLTSVDQAPQSHNASP
jgi:hypothetical protein